MSRRRAPRQPLKTRLHTWLRQHRDALDKAMGYARQSWLTSLLTVIAIAVALALPAALLAGLGSVGALVDFGQPRQIDAFMRLDIDGQRLSEIASQIERRPDVGKVDIISRAQSLADFRDSSGIGDALDLLPENPLPAVLVVHPADSVRDPAVLRALRADIEKSPQVDRATLNSDWLEKLAALTRGATRLAWLVGAALALCVLLLIHFSLRSEIIRRREEIQVVKLVGGSSGYVRRPFLYFAVMLGLAGALLALLALEAVALSLAPALADLSRLYGRTLTLGMGPQFGLMLLAAGIMLSAAAAWLTIGSLLRQIEPGNR